MAPLCLPAQGDVDDPLDVDEVEEHIEDQLGEKRERQQACP